MAEMEAALKTSFRKEMGVKMSPEDFSDYLPAVNVQNGVTGDEFFVDDFLDFSDENGFVKLESEKEDYEERKVSSSFSPQKAWKDCESHGIAELTSELSVPAEDLADLEWLSHFVDDSFPQFSPARVIGTLTEFKPKPETPKIEEPSFTATVPAKARSKRTRTGGRIWSVGCPPLSESSSSSTSSISSSTVEPVSSVTKPPAKKQRKKPTMDGTGRDGAQPPRRCSHCGVQKTPQWRAGPLGAKTLCNACGVRFKSGRLLPEYRPACSPTFSVELHSNHHRKVLEMRRHKEILLPPEPDFSPPVEPS